MKIRVIIQSNENGEHESVIFTEQFDEETEYFLLPHHTIDKDKIIEMDEIEGFPVDYYLKRT